MLYQDYLAGIGFISGYKIFYRSGVGQKNKVFKGAGSFKDSLW